MTKRSFDTLGGEVLDGPPAQWCHAGLPFLSSMFTSSGLGLERKRRLIDMIAPGTFSTTAFSGMDAGRYAAELAWRYAGALAPVSKLVHTSSCDRGAIQRRFLQRLSRLADNDRSCVFDQVYCYMYTHIPTRGTHRRFHLASKARLQGCPVW